MEQKKIVRIKVFGWFFIFLSFLYLIALSKTISSYYKLRALYDLSESINFLPKLHSISIFTALIGFIFFFVTGVGIMRLKRRAYYAALSLPFICFVTMIQFAWIFGSQFLDKISIIATIIYSIIISFFFMRTDVIDEFKADHITKRGKRLTPKRFVILSLVTSVLVVVIPIIFWTLLVHFKFKDQLPIMHLKPRKIEYRITDQNFVLNDCIKRNVFDYSLSIPREWKIGRISNNEGGFGWNVGFVNMENSELKAVVLLDSKGFGQILLPISKMLNFKTVYDLEKMINYPNWTPIYFVLKTLVGPSNLVGIDEAATLTWRGFIKVVKSKENNIFDGSLYSLKRDKTCSIRVLFKEGAMTSGQARSILASLEFKGSDEKSEPLFENGKSNLTKADFISAQINFMNALYFDQRNPKYAYYLARSLFEDTSAAGRKGRLASSNQFLEYAIRINPEDQEAKELLVSVKDEIKKN